jgi:hypothetical protein
MGDAANKEAPSKAGPTDLSGSRPKKYMNGWTAEQEALMAKWADIAGCYRWLHDRAEKKFSRLNMGITIPVIILSTLTGTANFAIGSFIAEDDQTSKRYAQAGIGAVSIFAGILTTLGNFLRYAQGSEAFRVSAIGWGKFQRQIAVEIAIHPNERMDCMEFLNICRQSLDRLIEQSPQIPDDIIRAFETEFKDMPELTKPDICHGLEHTKTFDMKRTRLTNVIGDVVLYMKQKKRMLRDDIMPDLTKNVTDAVRGEIQEQSARIDELNRRMERINSPKQEEGSAPRPHSDLPNWRNLLYDRKSSRGGGPVNADDILIDVGGPTGPTGPTGPEEPPPPNTIEEAPTAAPFRNPLAPIDPAETPVSFN